LTARALLDKAVEWIFDTNTSHMPHAGLDANKQSVAPNSYKCRITDLELIVGLDTDSFPVFNSGGPTPFTYKISRCSGIGQMLFLMQRVMENTT
jgi:hypothetical protein